MFDSNTDLNKVATNDLFTEILKRYVDDPNGMPRMGTAPLEAFMLALSLTPVANVEVVIRNDQGHVLMTYRGDADFTGWHFPGGLISFGENIENSCKRVAFKEVKSDVNNFQVIGIINNSDLEKDKRHYKGHPFSNHFIAIVVTCDLIGDFEESDKEKFFNPTNDMPIGILPCHVPVWQILQVGNPVSVINY